jgi:hypothetical protein
MNHVNEYVIHNRTIWTKGIANPAESWTPIFFPGRNPWQISADGSLLVVIDENGDLYHKKILKESLLGEKWQTAQYRFTDTSCVNNWSKSTFSPPSDTRISLSERGKFNRFYEDSSGKTFKNKTLSQLILSSPSRHELSVHELGDLRKEIKIALPERSDSSFTLIKHCSSASTIMILGYEYSIQPNPNKDLAIYTLFFDRVVAAWKYLGTPSAYVTKEHQDPLTYVSPSMTWKKHSLPNLSSLALVTGDITILQTGAGNLSREMHIGGTNQRGELGFYYKMLGENSWHFMPSDQMEDNLPLSVAVFPAGPKTSNAHTWKSGDGDVTLHDFSLDSLESKLSTLQDGCNYEFSLRRKADVSSATSFTKRTYDLVLPNRSLKTVANQLFHTNCFETEDHIKISISIDNQQTLTIRKASPLSHKTVLTKV